MEEEIRVLRVLEYVGPRSQVERTINLSIHGEKSFNGVVVRAATVGNYPEILCSIERSSPDKEEK